MAERNYRALARNMVTKKLIAGTISAAVLAVSLSACGGGGAGDVAPGTDAIYGRGKLNLTAAFAQAQAGGRP